MGLLEFGTLATLCSSASSDKVDGAQEVISRPLVMT
jgi:hypothetical protein